MAFDLHTHSDVSDGTERPALVARTAAAAGLNGFALTDHDTTAGWEQAAAAAHDVGVELIRGIEISTRFRHDSIHLLGYGIDPLDDPLAERLATVRRSRDTRARRMVELIGLDYPITWPDVLAQIENVGSGPAAASDPPGGVGCPQRHATVGRPHIADALVAAGVVADRAEAFAGILSASGPYYLPHDAPSLPEAVRLVRGAGGVAVIAHPGASGRGNRAGDEAIAAAAAEGLAGLEVFHRDNPPEERARLTELAARYDLLITGGSDYHGTGKPNRLGENTTPDHTVRALMERIEMP